jgi:hypothetical protein
LHLKTSIHTKIYIYKKRTRLPPRDAHCLHVERAHAAHERAAGGLLAPQTALLGLGFPLLRRRKLRLQKRNLLVKVARLRRKLGFGLAPRKELPRDKGTKKGGI